MSLERDLCNQAKAYAQKIANMGQLVHSSQAERGDTIGENLAYACSSNGNPLTGESATKMWYVLKHLLFFQFFNPNTHNGGYRSPWNSKASLLRDVETC